ncbi:MULTISPECIES: invasin domain 3-containing protein [unclassified Paenibacillus]|uniref:invasin domain 3-containing protein n=1 Tax=unclassified Paenibacillus TaxID=185978 RepID=UPI0036D27CB8
MFGGFAHASNPAVPDQQQLTGTGNSWVNADYSRYQTFTPAISGTLDRFELNLAGSYGTTGAMILKLYKESNLGAPLATLQVPSFGDGWVSADFSGLSVYLKRNNMYRMVLSTEFGGSAGFGWYMSGGNPYPGGSSPATGYDFAFRTYMVADQGLSIDESGISVDQASLLADGTSQTTIRVKLRNAQGSDWTTGGHTVAIAATAGTIGPVTDNNDGTYSATLTAPLATGTATVRATVDGTSLASTASVQFVPGAPSPANSTIQTGVGTLTANGTSQTSIIIRLKDASGNALTTGGSTVTIASTLGNVGAVTDNNNGTYSAVLTSSVTAGTATVSAKVGGIPLTSTTNVQFVPGSASAASSTITAAHASLTADGTSHTTVTVTLKDAQGNLVTAGGVNVNIAATLGTIGAVRNNNNGTYSAALTTSTTIGTASVSASVDGTPLSATVSVQFVAGAVDAVQSTVSASSLVVRADGSSSAQIQVKLMDAYGHPLSGKRVLLAASGGDSIISGVNGGVSDVNGVASFTVSNTAAENVTYSATEEASGTLLNETVSIRFAYDQPPDIGLHISPETPTFDSVTVTVTATVYGASNSVAIVKWAEGNQSPSYFDTQGETIANQFTIEENGIYSIYVTDTAGNANVRQLEIDNIMPRSGDANLNSWVLNGQGGAASLAFQPGTDNYSIGVENAVHGLTMTLAPSNSYATVYVNNTQVVAGSPTAAYSLVVGANTFNITVIAQNGVRKTYTLQVNRAAISGYEPSPTVGIQINGRELPGLGKLTTDGNGVPSIDVLLNKETISKVVDPLIGTTDTVLTVAVKKSANRVDLRLTGEAINMLADKAVIVLLQTSYGQYRLPVAELMKQLPVDSLTSAAEARITIQHREQKDFPGLLDAAKRDSFLLASQPLEFNVSITEKGISKTVNRFDQYIERVIYLPEDAVGSVSTVAIWDEMTGLRPVPTVFRQVDGRPAAVIHSLTNSTYVPIMKTADLTDLQGHWAATEIQDMNRRMIVNGLQNGRFVPEETITRAELAALLARALGLPIANTADSSGFRDVSAASWYAGAVAAVHAYGIMDGVQAGRFAPEQHVSRQEAVVALVRAMKFAPAVIASSPTDEQKLLSSYNDHAQIGSWAKDSIAAAIQLGLIQGYGDELRPQQALTRAEAAVLLYRMLGKAELIG